MAKLTTKARKAIPTKKFAGPGRSYPIENKAHARAAIRLAPCGVKAGNITSMQDAMIDSKARKVLAGK